jgi:hypothetical protein
MSPSADTRENEDKFDLDDDVPMADDLEKFNRKMRCLEQRQCSHTEQHARIRKRQGVWVR